MYDICGNFLIYFDFLGDFGWFSLLCLGCIDKLVNKLFFDNINDELWDELDI